MRCNCEEKTEKCNNPEFAHLHVEYYGTCKQLPVSYNYNIQLLTAVYILYNKNIYNYFVQIV